MSMPSCGCDIERGQPTGPGAPCPFLMSDGRLFTNYNTTCRFPLSQPMSSYEMRQLYINNAERIMEEDRRAAGAGCIPRFRVDEQGTLLPEQNAVRCTPTTCTMSVTDASGLGTGRIY
jgi:hypothetical protein